MLKSHKAGKKSLAHGHIPAPKRDQQNWNEAADDAADSFGAFSMEFSADPRANLATDEPAERTTNQQADNGKYRRADEQSNILCGDGGSNADGKKAADGADNSARQRAHIRFAEAGFTHKAKVSYKGPKCNREG